MLQLCIIKGGVQAVYGWSGERRILIGASLSEPHTNSTSAARVCYMYRTYVKEVPGVQIRHVRRRGADRGYGCRHARRRRPANSHVHGTTSACWLTTYGFATSMDTTGSSQNRDERLRRRRERERTRRAAETAEQRERRLRQRRERDRLDALRRGGCSKCAIPVVRDRHLRLLRRGRPDCKG